MTKTTLSTVVHGYRVEIDFNYSPPCKGERERGTGLQLSPDEPAEIEITGVRLVDADDLWEIITEEVSITKEEVMEAIINYEDDPT